MQSCCKSIFGRNKIKKNLLIFLIKSPLAGKLRRRDVELSSFSSDWNSFNEFLKPIAIKRVAGSPELIVVRDVS